MPFKKGKSGNPGGRPKEAAEVKAAARSHGLAAIDKLVELMNGDDNRISVTAAQAILDRGFGKPSQSMTLSGEEGKPPVTVVERVIVHPKDSEGL